MELVLIAIAFVIGVFVGSKYENDRYPQKLENDLQIFMGRFQDDIKTVEKEYNMMNMANAELRAIRKENEEKIEQQERKLAEKDKEINDLYDEIDNTLKEKDIVLKEKDGLIAMINNLISHIQVEPYMEFTAQLDEDINRLSTKYAIEYLGLTKEKISYIEHAKDNDINKLQLKYASVLIKNILIADLDRKYITEYLTQPSKPMPTEKQNKEIDAEYDEKIQKGMDFAKKVFGSRDDV